MKACVYMWPGFLPSRSRSCGPFESTLRPYTPCIRLKSQKAGLVSKSSRRRRLETNYYGYLSLPSILGGMGLLACAEAEGVAESTHVKIAVLVPL